MTGEMKPSLITYSNLLSDERAKLEVKESQIAKILLTELGIENGVSWVATQDSRHRTIRLIVSGETPRMLFEVSEIVLAELSSNDLIEELKRSLC